jgi:hypothetical protein
MGTISNAGGEADRLAGTVMEEIDADTRAHREEEARRAARKKAAGPRKKIGLYVLCVLFVALTALNLTGLGPFGFNATPPKGADLRMAMSGEVDDLVDQLELHREEFGAFPESLAEVGEDDSSWDYERLSPDRCRVALNEGREVVTAELTEAGQ